MFKSEGYDVSKKRKEVVKSIEEAVALIKDGQTVAIGGFGADNHPMAIVREIIRTGKKNPTIVASATAGLEIDLLIGADCVKKLIAPYVGQEMYCPIGHNYRKYAEFGQIEVMETSEYLLYAGFFAAASGQEFFAWRGGVGTSIPQLNKELVEFIDPIGKTKKIIAVPPLRPDWAIIHVGWSDVYGNGQHLGARFGDRWMARAVQPHHDADRAHRAELGDPQKSVYDHDRLCRRGCRGTLWRSPLRRARFLQGRRRVHSGLRQVQ